MSSLDQHVTQSPGHRHQARDDHSDDADHGGQHYRHIHGANKAFAIGVWLNLVFVIVEVAFGWWSNSLALIADAGHNFGDVIGLLMAWGALKLAQAKPSHRFTYGFGGTTILAALANGMLLVFAMGAIALEAYTRLGKPEPVSGQVVLVVAFVGVIINSATALLFMKGRHHDLNMHGAYLHMVSDAAVSLGVVVAGGLMLQFGWTWIDPVISLLIAAVIGVGTWGMIKESTRLALQGVPRGIDLVEVRNFLATQPGVHEVHDLHIWAMSTTETAMTAHLVMPDGHPGDRFFANLADELQNRFSIGHPTIQIEMGQPPG